MSRPNPHAWLPTSGARLTTLNKNEKEAREDANPSMPLKAKQLCGSDVLLEGSVPRFGLRRI